MMKKILFSIVLFALLTSCSSKKKEQEEKYYYDLVIKDMKSGNLLSAKKNLEKISSDFPYSSYADKVEIMTGFIDFITEEYTSAISDSDKFIKLRPANQYVSYMYFLKAESYFAKRSDYLREKETSEMARESFLQLISRFPNSKYAEFSKEQIAKLDDDIVEYHLSIARTHLTRDEFVPAIKQLKIIMDEYPKSKFLPESLYLQAKAYQAIGLIEQSEFEFQKLRTNYPDNNWANLSISEEY